MTKQAQGLTNSDNDDIKEARLAKVLDWYSRGFSEREIADKLLVSKTTVHNDIVELRNAARDQLQEHIESLPHAWQLAHSTFNQVLKKAWELADRKGLEFNEEIDIINLIADLTEKRYSLYGDPGRLDAAVAQKEAMKQRIARLEKDAVKPKYEVDTVTEPASGTKGKTTTRITKIKKRQGKVQPIV
jgi:predicted DNA-binding protein YlxM (UPF0122 family)